MSVLRRLNLLVSTSSRVVFHHLGQQLFVYLGSDLGAQHLRQLLPRAWRAVAHAVGGSTQAK